MKTWLVTYISDEGRKEIIGIYDMDRLVKTKIEDMVRTLRSVCPSMKIVYIRLKDKYTIDIYGVRGI